MKRAFVWINSLAGIFAAISIGWLVFDFIAYQKLGQVIKSGLSLTEFESQYGIFIWIGLLVFLVFHIISFLAIASQFQMYRKATLLRVGALILGIISCFCILSDIGSLSDIGKEYAEGLDVQLEYNWLYLNAFIHGLFFFIMLANLIEAFIQKKVIDKSETVIKDEVVFTVVHCVGILCSGLGLFAAFGALGHRGTHAILHYTFPFVLFLTLIPYVLVAFYWIAMKIKDKPSDWYDEKQFHDIARAGLVTMFITIPFLFIFYVINYGLQIGPFSVLWFPFYLYFTIQIFSWASLYFSYNE